MSEELKKLFEGAGIPAEVGVKVSALFEATVAEASDNKVAGMTAELQESFEKRFEEVKESWTAEATKKLDEALDQALNEWASDNVVAIDSQLKVDIAESFMSIIGSAITTEGYTLANKGETLSEKFKQDQEVTQKLAEDLQEQLNQAQATLLGYQKAECIQKITEGMSAVSADRVNSLCEKLQFKDLDSFSAQAKAIAEAFGKKEDGGDDKGGDKGGDGDGEDDKGVDKGTEDDKKGDGEGDKGGDDKGQKTNEAFDSAAAAAAFLRTGRVVTGA